MLNVREQEDTHLGRIRAHIKQLNDDYTELSKSYVALQVEPFGTRYGTHLQEETPV